MIANTKSTYIHYDISSLNWVADSWYYVDVFVKNHVQGTVYVRDVIKPAGWGGAGRGDDGRR